MKIPIPAFTERVLDVLAMLLFPSRKYVTATLGLYAVLIGGGLALYSDNWLWLPATALCLALGWLIMEMLG